MQRTSATRHRFALALSSALVAVTTLAWAPAPTADAATIGALFVTPTTGDQDQYVTMDTNVLCPTGTQATIARILGPGITDNGDNTVSGNTSYAVLPPNSSGGFSLTATAALKDVFITMSTLPQTATYDLVITCQNNSGSVVYGEIAGEINVVAGTGFSFTYSQASAAVSTTTTLAAGPTDPVATGTQTTLTATITPPAAGAVRFKRNGIDFGPLVQVHSGQATYAAAIPAGSSQLTAEFTPTDSNAYLPSAAAAVSYLVVPAPVLTGTPAVGSTLRCNINNAAGANAFAWLANGAVEPGQAAATAVVPASWAGKQVACRVTTSEDAGAVTQTSNALTVATPVVTPPPPAPVTLTNLKLPVVKGTAKVGKTLKCSAGTWSTKPTSVTYQWLRNGKAIKGAKKASYKLVKADRRKKVSCKVTAAVTGATQAATSKARAVA